MLRFSTINKFGVGICIVGDHGAFISAKTLLFEGSPEPREEEAVGLLHGLIWAQELGLQNINC